MLKNNRTDLSTFIAISATYGLLLIPLDFLLSFRSGSLSAPHALFLSFRSCGLITLTVFLCSFGVLTIIKIAEKLRHNQISMPLKQAILIGSGVFVIFFLFLFHKYYSKMAALVASELIGGTAAVLTGGIFYFLLRSGNRSQRLADISPIVSIASTSIILVLLGISFFGIRSTMSPKNLDSVSKHERPNILLIVMDTVRADHLSVYGYHRKTSPFLEEFASESAVFKNAFAPAPWTLPSHASLFTGLYPSQHNAHAEHFWLDDNFVTLAEHLNAIGYQTVCFSNNDYISSYHNLVQGFERTWYKGNWSDDFVVFAENFGNFTTSFFTWCWDQIQLHFLERIIDNPASISAYPTAGFTNRAIFKWFDTARDKSRPFFIFINYMDAHLPYNPNDETARLFLKEKELTNSYKRELRFPPIDYCLDLSKSGFTQNDIFTITALYDACVRYLDGELENLFKKIVSQECSDDTVIIITSDHGEYLGTRNRLAHGLGLYKELIHIPLIVRYPALFEQGARPKPIVSLVDVLPTILSIAKIEDHSKDIPGQLLFDLKHNYRHNVFSEFRFPLHLLVKSSLRDDNSRFFIEQKTVRNQTHQYIWKSRGEPEFYNVTEDPLQIQNNYYKGDETAETMKDQMLNWFKLHTYSSATSPKKIDSSQKENLELIERLRGLGYVR